MNIKTTKLDDITQLPGRPAGVYEIASDPHNLYLQPAVGLYYCMPRAYATVLAAAVEAPAATVPASELVVLKDAFTTDDLIRLRKEGLL